MAKYLVALLSAVMLGGCAGLGGPADLENWVNYLPAKTNPVASDTTWTEYSPPRAAWDPVEDAVLRSALTGKEVPLAESKVFFIVRDPKASYVDVVRNGEADDRFSKKEVVRYRVVGGRIAAKTEKSLEIFPDVEFERAVLSAAAKAAGPSPVSFYHDPVHPVSLAAEPVSTCAAVVKVFEWGRAGGGTPIAEKNVNGCFAENRPAPAE